jgi:hypothetical protein
LMLLNLKLLQSCGSAILAGRRCFPCAERASPCVCACRSASAISETSAPQVSVRGLNLLLKEAGIPAHGSGVRDRFCTTTRTRFSSSVVLIDLLLVQGPLRKLTRQPQRPPPGRSSRFPQPLQFASCERRWVGRLAPAWWFPASLDFVSLWSTR